MALHNRSSSKRDSAAFEGVIEWHCFYLHLNYWADPQATL